MLHSTMVFGTSIKEAPTEQKTCAFGIYVHNKRKSNVPLHGYIFQIKANGGAHLLFNWLGGNFEMHKISVWYAYHLIDL